MPITRRAFTGLLAATALAADRRTHGVRLGVGTYSFRGLSFDQVVRILREANAPGVELEAMHVEPAGDREAVRKWRLSAPLDEIRAKRKALEQAGIAVNAYSIPINDSFTDEEIDRAFLMAKALGAPALNTAATMTIAKRLAPFAAKHKLPVGLHPSGNANTEGAIGSAESYRTALAISPLLNANLDLYGSRNWGPDPVAFVREIEKRITTIHFHDRKGSQWVPFGEGELPTRELLLLAKKDKAPFAFSIERIYNVPDLDHVHEIRRSLDFCRRVLE